MSTIPDVTVVVPTHDRWDLLSSFALPSALGQRGVAVEVIVVDDGSEPPRPRPAALDDTRVRVLRHDEPRGVAAARNTGIVAAETPWVAFLDDDDLWAPDKLSTQLAALAAAGASFAYCSVLVLDDDAQPVSVSQAPPPEQLASRLRRSNVLTAGSSNVVASTALLRELGGFDEGLGYAADWDLWVRLVQAGRAAACPEPLVGYMRHPRRMSLGGRAAVAEIERLRAKHAAAGLAPDPAGFLSWIAAENRRAGHRLRAIAVYTRAAFTYREPRQLVHAAATAFDWRGKGLRHLLRGGRGAPEPPVLPPAWLRGR